MSDPSLVLGFVLLDLAVILVAARAVGALAVRLGQPRVVGEIVAGVLLGPTLLGARVLVWSESPGFLHCDELLAGTGQQPTISSCLFPPESRAALGVIGQLALALFAFLIGLELERHLLRGHLRSVTLMGIGSVAIPLVAGFAITPLLYEPGWFGDRNGAGSPSRLGFGLTVGALLAVTALPVMARILDEKHLMRHLLGVVGIAVAAVTTVLMFMLSAAALEVSAEAGSTGLLAKLVLVSGFVAFMLLAAPTLVGHVVRRSDPAGDLPAPLFAFLIGALLFASYLSDRLGLSVVIGGFLVGIALPPDPTLRAQLALRLRDLTVVVLLPVFLAFSGLNTDLGSLERSSLWVACIFFAAAVVSKWGSGAVTARLVGFSWVEGSFLGVLLNCRGLLVLVVALAALDSGIIAPQLHAVAVIVALATTAMTGPMIDRLDVGRARVERPGADRDEP